MSKLPSTSPANYKTNKGLFDAFIRALGAPPIDVNRAWWLETALQVAEERDPRLLAQFRRLMGESSPRTLSDLIPVGHSRPGANF